MPGQKFLGIVWTVKVIAVAVLARPGMVPTDDEMRAAVILADDRVPERFAGPAHAHRQRQQAQHGGLLRVAR